MFNMFDELFAPGRKHTHDEQKRLELTREDVGDTDPGRGPIDLASGKVVIRLSPEEPEAEPAEDSGGVCGDAPGDAAGDDRV
ncbi:DUF6191 domain-containing protein [Streptomyces sp. NPDC006654]|uniref:DUF6191 domain-containing protein n=1 Tax=unclassified Streptomyces TaxID=2593676 RepID=UPI0033C4A9F4